MKEGIYLNFENESLSGIIPKQTEIYLNKATGYSLPPFWLNRKVQVLAPEKSSDGLPEEVKNYDTSQKYLENLFQDAVLIKFEEDTDIETNWWRFPIDPVISVSVKNTIARRNVAKIGYSNRRGSIKESWSTEDYEVNIAGILIGSNNSIPGDDLKKLRRYCEAKKIIEIRCKLLEIFGIKRLVIENFSLPFTKGMENQMYSIKGYSDDKCDLLIQCIKDDVPVAKPIKP